MIPGINPRDASSRSIAHGDQVKVFNQRGETLLTANLTPRIMAGVVGLGEADPPDISVTVESNSGVAETTTINQTKGTDGTDQVDFGSGRVSGERLGYTVSGVHPVKLFGFQIDYDIEGTEEMREP